MIILKKNGIVPFVKYEIENYERMLSYVQDSFGVGVVLKDFVKNNDKLETKDIDIKNEICISFIKEQLAPSTKEFLKMFDII